MSLILATAAYKSLINERKKPLNFFEYVSERGFQLNETCVNVFYNKIAHLKETDFVEIDRSILETFGYSNMLKIVKKNGIPELDENGNVRLVDNRNDFTNAVQALRKMKSFKEGKSLDDVTADYVLVPDVTVRGRGAKRNLLYVKKRMLEHLCIMSHSRNSHMIREYFLELYRAVNEYIEYQRDFQNMKQMVHQRQLLRFKDRRIDELSTKMDQQTDYLQRVIEQNEHLSKQLQMHDKKLDTVTKILYNETNNKVLDVENENKKQELVVLQNKRNMDHCVVLRGQKAHVNVQLKRTCDEMYIIGSVETYKNPINLYNLFSEQVKKQKDERFKVTHNKVILQNGATPEELLDCFISLEEQKHTVANRVKGAL